MKKPVLMFCMILATLFGVQQTMKKSVLMFCMILATLFAVAGAAFAGTPLGVAVKDGTDYSVTTSTTTLGAPIVAGSISIKSLTLSNSGALAQTVTFYKNATSTTAVTEVFKVTLPAAAGFYRPVGDQDLYDLIDLANFTVRKSTTGTNVDMYINYH